jgi:hypothetical protein
MVLNSLGLDRSNDISKSLSRRKLEEYRGTYVANKTEAGVPPVLRVRELSHILCNISNPTMSTALDFKFALMDQSHINQNFDLNKFRQNFTA